MFKKSTAGWMAAASILALSCATAQADPIVTGEMEWGFAWVSEDSYDFGQYTGLTEEDAYIIGDVDLVARDAYDSGGTTYWVISGSNLGLDSGSLGLEFGHQGSFDIRLGFDQTPRFQYDDASSPYIFSEEGTMMTLPVGWVPSNRSVVGLSELSTSLRDLTFSTDREKYSGGFTFYAMDKWKISSDFTRELKTGNRSLAAIFGASGGNPAGSLVPEPIDYRTDNLNVALSYADKKAQFVMSYNLSMFEDANTHFTFQNPFATGSWAASASYPGYGAVATPPDNKAQKLSIKAGYNIDDVTRVTANVSINQATQDAAFMDYTINPAILATITAPLPRSGLDGKVTTTIAKLAVISRPMPELNLKASYRYENRDNSTPRDTYIYIPSDSAAAQGTLTSGTARINMPYSRETHLIELDAAYRFSSKLKLSGGYDYEEIKRDYQEVAKTTEHRVEAKLRFKPEPTFSGWVGVYYSMRDTSDYITNMPYAVSHTEDYHGGPGPYPQTHYEQNPLMNKFFFAARDQFKVKANLNFVPSDTVNLSLTGRYTDSQYGEGFSDYGDGHHIGRDANKSYSVTLDGSFVPSKTFNAHAFVTFDNRINDQVGLDHSGFEPYAVAVDYDNRWWSMETDDQTTTIGIGAEWAALTDKLSLTIDLMSMRGDTSISYDHADPFTGGSFSNEAPLPDLSTDLVEAEIGADYKITDQLSLRVEYLFQDISVDDYALDGVGNISNYVILLGNTSPDHSVHMVGISAAYKF